jgi:hypothetical protein
MAIKYYIMISYLRGKPMIKIDNWLAFLICFFVITLVIVVGADPMILPGFILGWAACLISIWKK